MSALLDYAIMAWCSGLGWDEVGVICYHRHAYNLITGQAW